MANNMKKVVALLLAVVLCVGQLPMRVKAEAQEPVVTVTVIENGTKTVTTTTDPEAGETVVVTDTVTSKTDPNGTKVDSESKVTEKTNEETNFGITDTNVETDTEYSQTTTEKIPAGTGADEEGFTSQGGDKVTQVEGSENKKEYDITLPGDVTMYESEEVKGQETTTVTNTETKTKTEEGSTTIETTDNDYKIVSDEKGEFEADPDAKPGKDSYSDATITQDPGDVKLNMNQKNNSVTETVYLDVEQAVKDNIQLPEEGLSVKTAEDGTVTETEVIYIYDENDKDLVIGYTVTKTVIVTEIQEDQEYTRGESTDGGSSSKDLGTVNETKEEYVLPERPAESQTKDAQGNVTTVTVEDVLDEDGKVIGYKSTTEVTDMFGEQISIASETIYGTTVTTSVDTQTTEVTTITNTTLTKDKVTTTNYARFYDSEGYELVVLNGKWVYKATLSASRENKGHGTTDITPLTPTSIVLDGKEHVIDRPNSYIQPVDSHTTPGFDYTYTGVRGEGSEFEEVQTSEGSSLAHMFEMKVGEQTFFVYCVDYNTTATPNYNYTMENVSDATYYDAVASKHIEAIGRYGYWGTSGDKTGSLKTLISNLTKARQAAEAKGESFYLTQSQINSLTEGDALTATQAAFWTYGNSGNVTIDAEQGNDVVTGLYQWLINLDPPAQESTDFINAEDFAQNAAITVKDKVANATNTTPAVYNTDISFSLAVQPDQKSDDLLVHVIVNGLIVETKRLAGKNSEGGTYETIQPDADGNYTIRDMELASGVNLTLNLSGTQHIDEGVYIYTSEKIKDTPSQTFVGLAEGERTVDLSVDMCFSVSEPEVQVKDPGEAPAQYKVDVLTEKKTDTETKTVVTYDVTVTTTITEETKREWDGFQDDGLWEPVPYSDDFGGDEDGDDETEEEEVVAEAPKTGDATLLWAAISGLSAGGMILLRKKREDEE